MPLLQLVANIAKSSQARALRLTVLLSQAKNDNMAA